MYKKLKPFVPHDFKGKRLKPVDRFDVVAGSYVAPLFINELRRALRSYPVVFLREPEGGGFGLYALLGLKPEQNLFVDAEGGWLPFAHMPLMIQRYPFALAKNDADPSSMLLCIDVECGYLSDTEGAPLVVDGQPGPVVTEAQRFLVETMKLEQATRQFCQDLAQIGLIETLNVSVKSMATGETETIGGCFRVSEEKLGKLSDADMLGLRKRGALSLIYAHLFSLDNMERLLHLREERGAA